MFGARSELEHFELTIPQQLYADWQRCFVYHKLSLSTIESKLGVPVWIGDKRISVASSSSIDKKTVTLDQGEISFGQFTFPSELDHLVESYPQSVSTLKQMRSLIGEDSLPNFLISYIETALEENPGSLAIHSSFSIEGYKSEDVNQAAITRSKGFIGTSQLELGKFPNAVHHVKVFKNKKGHARVFYKCTVGGTKFTQNTKKGEGGAK